MIQYRDVNEARYNSIHFDFCVGSVPEAIRRAFNPYGSALAHEGLKTGVQRGTETALKVPVAGQRVEFQKRGHVTKLGIKRWPMAPPLRMGAKGGSQRVFLASEESCHYAT